MYITNITDCDNAGFEYEVMVSDGKHCLLCLSTSYIDLGCTNISLISYFIESIDKTNLEEMSITKTGSYYEYQIVAKIVDIDKGIIKVFDFEIELDEEFPKDIKNGDFVKVDCIRIDCQYK